MDDYIVKPARMKDSTTGNFVGFTPAIYTKDGFILSSAYWGTTMANDCPLANSEDICIEQYDNANKPGGEAYRQSSLPYKSLMKQRP